ncbi:MAG: ABC transporter permease [Acidimicrobiia bacterium]
MLRMIGTKLVRLVPVLLLVSLGTFFMLELVPGDPALEVLGPDARPEQYVAVRHELGLDKPVVERYFEWMGDAVKGDFGTSLKPPVQKVGDAIKARLPVTLEITVLSMGMALAVAIPLALASAYRAGGRLDRSVNAVAFGALSVPSFLAGLLVVFFLVFHVDIVRWLLLAAAVALAAGMVVRTVSVLRSYPSGRERTVYGVLKLLAVAVVVAIGVLLFTRFPNFPRQGFVRWTDERGKWANLRSAFLPALTLATVEVAVFTRLLRADLITTLYEDFILAAKAKGMPAWRILLRDALRPSSFSVITVAGVTLGRLVGGTAIVEAIFNLPGMGSLIITSIGGKDYKVVQGAVLVVAVFYVLINVAVDIAYAYLDPRIRRRG